jgi:hypothetical protein
MFNLIKKILIGIVVVLGLNSNVMANEKKDESILFGAKMHLIKKHERVDNPSIVDSLYYDNEAYRILIKNQGIPFNLLMEQDKNKKDYASFYIISSDSKSGLTKILGKSKLKGRVKSWQINYGTWTFDAKVERKQRKRWITLKVWFRDKFTKTDSFYAYEGELIQ